MGKRCLSEMWENTISGGRGGACENSMGLSMYDGPIIETVKYILVNVWCMLDWIVTQIASAKSCSVRGASHQPAYMSSCLTISYKCLPCLPSG